MDYKYKEIKVDSSHFQNAINILNGAYYPLKGFLREQDFVSVLDRMRLKDNSIWSIPIVLDISEEEKRVLGGEKRILIKNSDDRGSAVLENIEIYSFNKKDYAGKVFGTSDNNHPGVAKVFKMKDYLIGGDLVKAEENDKLFPKHNYTPGETKDIFKKNGWKNIVAFQTRNVPHRSHEYLQKKALENVDGILIHPVIGKKKEGDFKDDIILGAYEILLKNHYPENKYLLGILPIDMHYAGPREAVMHALIRRNYGCTHMIIGRDHAGVGDYYDEEAAHRIFDEFAEGDLGIKILKYQNVGYCRGCGDFNEKNGCGHSAGEVVSLSGTKIREMIKNKESLPEELIRSEISEFLLNNNNPFV